MSRVFLSHTGSDDSLASEIGRWLTERGHEVFLDHDLDHGVVVGEEWERRLHERLRWADAVVCIVSPDYVSSTWCSAEVGAARSRGARILPLSAAPGHIHPLLGFVHHTDLTKSAEAARRYLEEALRRIDMAGGWGWPDDRSPFPGLRPFEVDMHQAFFGRSAEVQRLLELLRSPAQRAEHAAILLVGPSGSGKSSVLRAGLLPAIAEEPGWSALPPILPGAEPVTALTREIAHAARRVGLGWSIADVRRQLDDTGLSDLADELLLAEGEGRARRLLIAFDQFDEVLTIASAAERQRFVDVIRPALAGPVQLVATLRPEFLETLLTDPALRELPTRVVPLRPLSRDALPAVITGPARLARIEVDESLVARLVADTGDGQALPLLAFTLAQLAQALPAGGAEQRTLSEVTYDDLGGVRGALMRQADTALDEAVGAGNRRTREEVVEGLLRLVTVDEQGRPTRRRLARASMPQEVSADLDTFVARRLLVTDIQDGELIYDVAHEAFLSEWPPLAEAIAATTTALRARGGVEAAAAEWESAGQPAERLWEHGQLAAAIHDTGAHRRHGVIDSAEIDLSERAQTFLALSIRRDRWRRRSLVSVLSGLLVFALAAGVVDVMRQLDAQEQQRLSSTRQLMSQATALLDRDPNTALRLGIAAYRLHPDLQTEGVLLSTLLASPYIGSLPGQSDYPQLTVDEAGNLMASRASDGNVVLWRLSDDAPPRPIGQPINPWAGSSTRPTALDGFGRLALSDSGKLMAVSGPNSSVRLFDLSDPAAPRRYGQDILGEEDAVSSVAFSRSGELLAVELSGAISVWDITGSAAPQRASTLRTGLENLDLMAFGQANDVLVVGGTRPGGGNWLSRWDLSTPSNPRELGVAFRYHYPAVFNRQSALFASAMAPVEAKVAVWRTSAPANPPVATILTDGTRATALTFNSDGTELVTATQQANGESELERWSLVDPVHPQRIVSPQQVQVAPGEGITIDWERFVLVRELHDIAFAAEPDRLLTITGDPDGASKTVTVWDYGDRGIPRQYGAPIEGISGEVTVLPGGQTLVTTQAGGSISLWDLNPEAAPNRAGVIEGLDDSVRSLGAEDDGTLLVGLSVGDFEAWDISTLSRPTRLDRRPHGTVSFPPYVIDIGTSDPAAYSHTSGVFALSDAYSVALTDLTGAEAVVIPRPLFEGHDENALIKGLAISDDGRTLAITTGGKVALFDIRDWRNPRQTGPPVGQDVDSAAVFSSDGRFMAVEGRETGAEVFDISDPAEPTAGEILLPSVEVAGLAFSPHGEQLFTNNLADHSIVLWDVSDPARPRRLGLPLASHQTAAGILALAPDGRTLASAASGEVILWDLSEPQQPRRLGPPFAVNQASVSAAAFLTPTTLATGSPDGRVVLIDLSGLLTLRQHAVEVACSRAGGLSRDEWGRYLPGLEYRDTCP